MSTITRQPPSPVAPIETATVPDEERGVMRDVSWEFYDRLSDAIGEQSHIRMAYDGKDLEIMVTGFEHEEYGVLVTLFLAAVTTACRIHSRLGGQTTWKRLQVDRALQADQCVYFDAEKLAAVKQARAAKAKNADYPIPDLAVEIDISTPQVDRPGIYAKLGIFELWRFDGDVVVIEQLGPDGRYVAVERSKFLPVRPEDIRRWLVVEDSSDDLEWKNRLAEWAEGLAAGGNGA